MSYILDGLYLGSAKEASNWNWLHANRITHVVNCTKEHANYFEPQGIRYIKLNLDDVPEESLYPVLEKAFKFMKGTIHDEQRPGTVLVHCHAGISRSASVVLYYLMKVNEWNYSTALDFLRAQRPIVNPNSGFETQLISTTPEVKEMPTELVL